MKLKITKIRNVLNKRPNKVERQLNRKAVFVFPFRMVSGITNLTETGERNWKSVVADYTSFVSVLNGKENAIAVWEGSTMAVKDSKSEQSPLYGFIGKYQVGNYFNGYVEIDSSSTSIGPLVGDEQFKAIKHAQDITITFGHDSIDKYNYVWNPDNQDMYKLYIIPELFGNQWMRISNVNKYYKTVLGIKKIDRVDITFSTISDQLSDTGGVKRQFINTSSPGEGYAWPKIDENRNITLDDVRLREVPITSFQIRTDGAAGPSSIYFMGRPCFNENTNFDGVSTKRIVPPRRILAYKMTGSIMPKITLTGTASDNYYYSANSSMVLDEAYDSWKEKIGDTYNLIQSQNFEGGINIGNTMDIAKIKATNDWENTTTKKYPNNIKDDPSIKVGPISYDAGASPYLEIDRKVGKFTLDGYYTYAELLNHNAFINDQVIRLRNTIRNVTTWSLSRVPIVGGFLNDVVAGADYGWNNVKVILPTPAFAVWFACELLDLAILQGTNDVNYLPCDFFRSNTDSDLTQKAGVGNLSTAFRFFITDLYQNEANGDIKQTLYLTQKKDENGNDMAPVELWKPTSKPQYRGALDDSRGKCYGYIIDYINIKMKYSGDYTITFFNDDIEQDPVSIAEWRLISKGKSSGSMREWTNDMRLSFWEPNFTTDGQFQWPEAIEFPPPISAEVNQDIEIRPDNFGGVYTDTFNFGTNRTSLYDHFTDWPNIGPEFENDKDIYWKSEVNADWLGWINLTSASSAGGMGYYHQRGPFSSAITLSKERIVEMFNALVESQAVIADIEELRRSFKKVKIGIKMDWFGEKPNYNSSAPDSTYREFTLTIDEFLGVYQKVDGFIQHNTLTRSKILHLDVFIPYRVQYSGKIKTNGILSVNGGNITYSQQNWQLAFNQTYRIGDTDFYLVNNNKKYRYKLEKIVLLKV